MSGRGHRGKRPRGDGSRGPRSSSSSALPHHSQVSLIQTPMPCTLATRCLVFSMLWLCSCALHVHILPLIWSLLPSLTSCGTGTLFVTLLVVALPFSSFIIHRLHQSLHHAVFLLFMAIDLVVPRCMAAPLPTSMPQPPPTPTPTPTPTLVPSLHLQSSILSTSAFRVAPSLIISGALVVLALTTFAAANALWRARRHAGARCAGICCSPSLGAVGVRVRYRGGHSVRASIVRKSTSSKISLSPNKMA